MSSSTPPPAGNRFRWAVVGTGFAASLFAQALRWLADSDLVAVVARDETRGRAFAAAHGAGHVVRDIDRLRDVGGADAVFIATPHERHVHDAVACLTANYHVVVEKPFASTAAEAAVIAATAQKANRFCMEAMWSRFLPPVRRAVQLLRGGHIGDPRLFRADFSYAVDLATSPRLTAPIGGGALLDRGVYGVSLAVHLLGHVTDVQAVFHPREPGPDLTAALQLSFASGAVAQITASIESQGDNSALLVGTKATLGLAPPFFMSRGLSLRGTRTTAASAPGRPSRLKRLLDTPIGTRLRMFRSRFLGSPGLTERSAFPGSGHHFQLAEAVACIRSGRLESEIMPLGDSVETLRVMDLARSRGPAGG